MSLSHQRTWVCVSSVRPRWREGPALWPLQPVCGDHGGRSGWPGVASELPMGMHEAPAPTQRSASGTCGSHQSGEPLSDAAALETPPGPWPGRLPLASCHCMSRLVSHPGPGTRGACHVRSSGSLCSEKKKVSRLSNWRKHLNADTYIFPSLVSQGSGGQRAHLGPGRGRGRLRGLRGLGPACLFSSSGPLVAAGPPGLCSKGSFLCSFPFL